jgi:exodeoxyribonuclease V gamma subunit
MNDNAFPRRDPRREFNLIHSGKPRRCDRSRRLDDRYMFLEAIISARHRLHISYHGRSIQDNSKRPPSTVVRELQAVLGEGRSNIVIEHRLHGFSHHYFSDAGRAELFTYSTTAHTAAGKLYGKGARVDPVLFAGQQLNNGFDDKSPLYNPTVEQLASFYKSPCEFLLRNRLNLYLRGDSDGLIDEEPVDLGTLASYGLHQRLVDTVARLIAADADDVRLQNGQTALHARLQAAGNLPAGCRGSQWLANEWASVEQYVRTSAAIDGCAQLQDMLLANVINEQNENRAIAGVQLFQRFTEIKAKDKVPALIHHIHAATTGADETYTLVAGWDKKAQLEKLYPASPNAGASVPAKHWARLIELYRWGMQQPLPFVPAISFEYATKLRARNATPEMAVAEADKHWFGSDFTPNHDGLGNLANRYCFGDASMCNRGNIGSNSFPINFESLAIEIEKMWLYWTKAPGKRDHSEKEEGNDV